MIGDIEVDIVVVGGGGAGMAAAVQAAQLGATVAVLEKDERLGGATARSVGSITASGTRLQAAAGHDDTPDLHFEDMGAFAGELAPRDNLVLRRLYVQHSGSTLHWLMSLGVAFFGPMPEPPHRKPRMHNVLPNAEAYIHYLRKAARKHGVQIRTDTAAESLITDQGRVTGVQCRDRAGRACVVTARRAVILAAGDFSASAELKRQHIGPGAAEVEGVNRTSGGDGIRLGLSVGGHVVNGDLALGPELRFVTPAKRPWVQSLPPSRPLTRAMRLGLRVVPDRWLRPVIMAFATSYLAPSAELFRQGAILVNEDGRRFSQEVADPALDLPAQRHGNGYIVLDARLAKKFRTWPHYVSTAPGIAYAFLGDYRRNRRDIFHEAADLGALARQIGVPAENLEAEVARTNAASAPDQRLDQAPFVALGPVRSWIVITEGGLAVDERLRVLDRSSTPIPGLLAAGSNGQGGLLLEGHGHHLGWAFVSGRLAAQEAVSGSGAPGTSRPATSSPRRTTTADTTTRE